MPEPSPAEPTNLHITHSWGGGVDRWVRDFCGHDRRSGNLVLENLGTFFCYGIGLRLLEGRSRRELGRWHLRDPVGETRVRHREYRDLVEGICEAHGVTHVIVSSLMGHSLDALDLGLPTTRVHHDYYPYCPNVYLFYDRPCGGCDPPGMADCLSNNPVDFARGKGSVAFWQELREAYLEALGQPRVLNVCPTPGMVAYLGGLHPGWGRIAFSVIPHGIGLPPGNSFGGAPEGRRLRVVLLGTQHIVKGLEVLRAAFERARLLVDLTFLGSGTQGRVLSSRFGVRCVEVYDHARLASLLDEGGFDLALLTSTFHETFCYTLSEVWARAVPPAARPVGSFLDRIEEGRNGFLLGDSGEDLVDFLLFASDHRDLLRQVSRNLQELPVRTIGEMVEAHYEARSRWTVDCHGRGHRAATRTGRAPVRGQGAADRVAGGLDGGS